MMPNVRTSTDLLNNYNEVSDFCRSNKQSMVITKDGVEDLVVINAETYKEILARYELYSLLEQGLKEIENGEGTDFDEFMEEFWMEDE